MCSIIDTSFFLTTISDNGISPTITRIKKIKHYGLFYIFQKKYARLSLFLCVNCFFNIKLYTFTNLSLKKKYKFAVYPLKLF